MRRAFRPEGELARDQCPHHLPVALRIIATVSNRASNRPVRLYPDTSTAVPLAETISMLPRSPIVS